MSGATSTPAAASLIAQARRDLRYAESVLTSHSDRLLAIIAVAGAAKRADDATFALLDETVRERPRRSGTNTHLGYAMVHSPTTKEP